ncbi:NADP-dependent oxidoreductase domain-containing protein [Mycena metata]|uniref:NADP-dependent oxidoreductase domain-containing protein n=1 Tax=Mycena metata TaxID=1033252 RepID=A0AAD7K6T1_9AGAR|nr:NADP-dependent oxidoreductase domain-containing protein [Mycena metata]
MEEIVRAFSYVIEKGWAFLVLPRSGSVQFKARIFRTLNWTAGPVQQSPRTSNRTQKAAFYWGTSEWTAQQIEEAHRPHFLSPKPSMLHRERAEKEYVLALLTVACKPVVQKYGLGTTAFSALHYGLLTGKYNDGIPPDSRFGAPQRQGRLETAEAQEIIRKVRELTKIAEAALALAWVAKHPNTSTIILGVSSVQQVLDNLKALEVLPKLTSDVMEQIEKIMDNKPAVESDNGRPDLDMSRRVSYRSRYYARKGLRGIVVNFFQVN